MFFNNIVNDHKFEPKKKYLEPLEYTDESDSESSSNYTSSSDESYDEGTIQSSQTIPTSQSLPSSQINLIQSVNDVIQFICNICSKSCKDKRGLAIHMSACL